MKRLGVLLATVILGAVSLRAEQWSKTYQISGNPDLGVETSDANIRVDTWDQKTIEATIITSHYKFGPGGLRVEEHQSGDTVEINLRFPHDIGLFSFGGHRVDINIHMPRKGKINLHTGDGNIELAGFGGEIELATGDGSQTIHGADGRLRASSGDGHITADGRFDALHLKTGDGHIDVRAAAGSTLAEEWTVRTGDGNVSFELPENMAADLYLHTGDGHIDVNLPITTEGRVKENELRGKLNGGGRLLTVQTGDGSISLRKG